MIPTFPTRKPTDASSRRAAACPPSSVPNSGQIRDATLVGVRANDVSESEHSRDQGEGDQIGESTTHVPRIRRSPGPCQGLEYPRVPHQPSSAPSACGATRRARAWRFSACHGRRRRRVILRSSRSCRCVDIVPSSQLPPHADEHRPERPILLAVGWTSPTVIGSALRVAPSRSLLGIVDQVQFAW